MSAISQEGNRLSPDTFIDLFEIDPTNVNPAANILYFTNSHPEAGLNGIIWKNNLYKSFPFSFTGTEYKADGTALARPQMAISNVDRVVYTLILSLGDLTGLIVTRTRTFFKFIDNGTSPDPNAHFPIDRLTIVKQIKQTATELVYELANPLDLPGVKLPARQILKDLGFPGVSRTRLRS